MSSKKVLTLLYCISFWIGPWVIPSTEPSPSLKVLTFLTKASRNFS
jgi:hypothetical protein